MWEHPVFNNLRRDRKKNVTLAVGCNVRSTENMLALHRKVALLVYYKPAPHPFFPPLSWWMRVLELNVLNVTPLQFESWHICVCILQQSRMIYSLYFPFYANRRSPFSSNIPIQPEAPCLTDLRLTTQLSQGQRFPSVCCMCTSSLSPISRTPLLSLA